MAAEKKKVETVTLKDLAAALAETHGLPKAQANTMLMEMVTNVGKHLKKGARIRIPGLGILQVRKRAATSTAVNTWPPSFAGDRRSHWFLARSGTARLRGRRLFPGFLLGGHFCCFLHESCSVP